MKGNEKKISVSVVGEKEGVGFSHELYNTVVSKVLKLWGAFVESLEETNATVLVLKESLEAVRASKVERVILILSHL